MSFQIHEQYLDVQAGFHVLKLRDGKKEHILQIPVGYDSCPACGHIYPKAASGEIDPKAAVGQLNESLDRFHANMLAYAQKHGLTVK